MHNTYFLCSLNSMQSVAFKKKILIAFFIYTVLQISYLSLIKKSVRVALSNSTRESHFSQQKIMQSLEYDPLFYVPHSTVSLWNERDFLVVIGIPSLDIPKRRWRRRMQRSTCWQFNEVATRDNNFTGAMLVLYLLGRHPLNNFVLSNSVIQEANQWHDILLSPMDEGLSDTNKMEVGKGYWGLEAEIGASRKTFIWFQLALVLFPRVPYLAKGDDDVFLRVPQYLSDLRRIPKNQTYWGRPISWKAWKNKEGNLTEPFSFMLGICYTMTRDIAEHVTSYKPLKKMVWTPYTKERLVDFRLMSMENEDVMIARTLYETKYPAIYVRETLDRIHSVPTMPVTDAALVIHVPEEQEYYIYMSHFTVNGTTTPDTDIVKQSNMVLRMLPPEQKNIIVKKH